MTTLNTTELYPKICEWLGMKFIDSDYLFWHNEKIPFEFKNIDFLNDFDQLQWIEDKLIKLGYVVATVSDKEGTNVTLYKEKEPADDITYEYHETTSAESKALALLQAVEELLNREGNK